MYTSKFGLTSTYYNNQNQTDDVVELVKRHGFKEFSPAGVTSFLSFRYPIGDLTMFQGVKRVPFGYQRRDGKMERQWFPIFPEKTTIPFKNAIKTIKTLLKKEIRYLATQEQIAIPLSGGVDSAMITALTREVFPKKEIYTYTAGFRGADEFHYAQMVSDIYDTIHHEYNLSLVPILASGLIPKLIGVKGEPLHPNEFALAYVEQKAKADGCTIALCGEGGDDLFGGYSHNLRMHYNHTGVIDFWEFFLDNYRYFSLEDRCRIINPKYLVDDRQLLIKYLNTKELPREKNNQMFYFIQKIHTPGLITRGVNAMKWAGIKPGFPFIEFNLVNFVNSLPFTYKVSWKNGSPPENHTKIHYKDLADQYTIPKYILKKLAENYFPPEFIYRPKVAFPIPFENWLDHINMWDLDSEVFTSTNISAFNAWHKFMLINLDFFVKEFRNYQT